MTTVQREDILKLADIHPELDAFVKKNGLPPPAPSSLPELRELFRTASQRTVDNAPSDLANGITIEDITVLARDGYSIPVRTYKPESPSSAGPLIIAIHGGGWMLGGLVDEEVRCRRFVKEVGASCVNIDYRLAPEYKFPAAINDCWDVVKWAAANAGELGTDPSKGFIVEGASAGGNLTDVIGHLARDEKLSPPITGLCEIIPVLFAPSVVPDKHKPEFLSFDQKMFTGLTGDSVVGMIRTYAADVNSPLFVPFNHPQGHTGLPPIFFQVAGMDPLRDMALIYEKVLRTEAGVRTKLKLYPGLPHGFSLFYPMLEVSKQHENDTVEGIRWLLSLLE